MERKNGNVISAPRNMLCNLIGKLIQRPVAQRNTNVTAAPFSPGLDSSKVCLSPLEKWVYITVKKQQLLTNLRFQKLRMPTMFGTYILEYTTDSHIRVVDSAWTKTWMVYLSLIQRDDWIIQMASEYIILGQWSQV